MAAGPISQVGLRINPYTGTLDLIGVDDIPIGILQLVDTPSSWGTTGQVLKINDTGDGLEWGVGGSGSGGVFDVEQWRGSDCTGADLSFNRTLTVGLTDIAQVFIDGNLLVENVDYTVSGNVITFSDQIADTHYITVFSIISAEDAKGQSKREKVESLVDEDYDTSYTEFTEVGGNITKVEKWEDNSKAVKLFTRDITYVGDDVTQTITTNEITGDTLTTDLAYLAGELDTITKTYVEA